MGCSAIIRVCLVVFCIGSAGCGQKRISELETQNRQLQQNVAALSLQLKESEELLEQTKKVWASRLASAREHTELLQADRTRLSNQLANAAATGQRSEQDRLLLTERMTSTQSELQRLTKLLSQSQSERTLAQQRLAELENTVADYRGQVENYAAYVNNLPSRTPASTGAPDSASRAEIVGRLVTPTQQRPLSRREFASIVQGLSKSEIATYLGNPDRTEGTPPRYLIYTDPSTYAIRPAERDAWVKIQMDNGVATFCFFP